MLMPPLVFCILKIRMTCRAIRTRLLAPMVGGEPAVRGREAPDEPAMLAGRRRWGVRGKRMVAYRDHFYGVSSFGLVH